MTEPAPAPPQTAHGLGTPLITAGGLIFAVGGLYFGRDIFIPFALAVVISFALSPLVAALRRLRLPRVVAVVGAVFIAFLVVVSTAFVVGLQLVELADNLPSYRSTVSQKIRSLQAPGASGGTVDKVTSTVRDIAEELKKEPAPDPANPQASTRPAAKPEASPIPVTIAEGQASPITILTTFVGPLLAPLVTAGLVIVFVVFVLLEREDLRDRFIRLFGAGDLNRSTQALDDAAKRVSRYLLMQLLVNTLYGVPIGLGLFLVGVPNAPLWGLLAVVLRFIPYLGPFIAALFPLALAIAVDPGWTMFLWVGALFLGAELISNNVVEPWLYGSSTGLSPLAIIVSAIFWTTLWGPAGLFLATPLTVCLVVIGRHVPQLRFLDVLLGSDPVLAPEERFYQRLLGGHLEEAIEIAEERIRADSALAFYEHVGIPALRLAENDRQRSAVEIGYRRIVADTAICVVRDIEENAEIESAPEELRNLDHDDITLLCIAGRTELDRAAAEMLAEAAREHGGVVRVLPPIAISHDALGQIDLEGIDAVCLSYLHPNPITYARYTCRRLRRRNPKCRLIVAAWNLASRPAADDLAANIGADAVVFSVAAALDHLAPAPASARSDTPAQDPEADRNASAAVLRSLGLSSTTGEPFESFIKRAAQDFAVPLALVTLARTTAPAPEPAPGDEKVERPASRRDAVWARLLEGEVDVKVFADVTKEERFATDPLILENGIRFFAAAPLISTTGPVIGWLVLIDTRPREPLGDDERELLRGMAAELVAELEAEPATLP
ncbi:AI-2E family transporter [Prosthecomicrobium sp. N25]|uniref:AI-2E family transporter n=1 Tax=Prosthecomicrobium sp. N25 TaxID=3129254 RepID=UPI0030787BEF